MEDSNNVHHRRTRLSPPKPVWMKRLGTGTTGWSWGAASMLEWSLNVQHWGTCYGYLGSAR